QRFQNSCVIQTRKITKRTSDHRHNQPARRRALPTCIAFVLSLAPQGVIGAMEREVHYVTTADGVRIAYAIQGEGAPFIWVPGWISHLDLDSVMLPMFGI